MRVRATSDLHLTQRTADMVFAALAELALDAAKHGGITVLAGDILDQPYQMHMPTWEKLRKLLRDWPGKVYVIPGNHDMNDQRAGYHVLGGLNYQHKVRVVDSPIATDIGRMVPYVHPDRSFPEAVEMALPTMQHKVNVLWAHQGVRGAYMNRMIRDRDGITGNDIPTDHLAVLGHYHMPQNLGPIIYCGSPYQTTFAEEGQEKGWLLWEDITVDRVPVRVPFEFEAPKHYTVAWFPEEQLVIPSLINVGFDRVRVKTTMSREEAGERMGELDAAGLAGVQIDYTRRDGLGRSAMVPVDAGPEEAALAYMTDHMVGLDQPYIADMEAFAEEYLWNGPDS